MGRGTTRSKEGETADLQDRATVRSPRERSQYAYGADVTEPLQGEGREVQARPASMSTNNWDNLNMFLVPDHVDGDDSQIQTNGVLLHPCRSFSRPAHAC